MKKKFKFLLVPLALGLGVTLVACGGNTTPATPTTTTVTPAVDYDALLRSLVIDQNGKTVSEDFDVPAKVQDTAITWTSSDESVVKFVPANDGKTVKAGIIIPTEAKTVTLKAKVAEGKEKEFKVKVLPIDVYSFMDAYKFPMASGVFAEEDVKFDTEVKITHKSVALSTPQEFTATVAFEVTGNNASLVTVDATNKKFVVGASDDRKTVDFKATFTYGNETAQKAYKSTVWHKLSAQERLTVFYDMVGDVTYDVYGYVLAKAGWNPSYNNGYLFIQDETKEGGFYIYRACMTKEVWDTLEFGTRVKASGMNSTNYNGLIETNGNVQVSVVTNETELPEGVTLPELTADQKTELKAGVESTGLILADVDQTKYLTGSSVKLEGWKVKEKTPAATTAKAGGDLLTLSKTYGTGADAKEFTIKVLLNKYAVDLDTDLATGILTAANAIKVGDKVNVHGLLSNYNGWQLYAYTTDFVSAATKESAIPADAKLFLDFEKGTDTAVKPAYAGDANVDLPDAPTVDDGFNSEVTYELKKSNYTSVKIESGKLVVTPGEKEESIVLTAKVVVKFGDEVVASKTFVKEFTTRKLTEQEQIAEDLKEIFGESFAYPTTITLPTEGTKYGSNFSQWTLVDGAEIATLENGVLTVVPTSTEKTVKIGYRATNGNFVSAEGAKVEVKAQYAPTPIATILSEKNTTKDYVIEGVIVAVNKPSGSGNCSLVIADSAKDLLFSYDGLNPSKFSLGDKVVLVGKLTFNSEVPQLTAPKLVYTYSGTVDINTVLKAETAVSFADATAKYSETSTNASFAEAFNNKLIKVTGYVGTDGNYAGLFAEADKTTSSSNFDFRCMASDDFQLAAYKGLQVNVWGVWRGNSTPTGSNGYISLQVVKVELANPTAAANKTTSTDKAKVELQMPDEGDNPTAEVSVSKTPWTTADITWTVSVPAADAAKVEVTQVSNGKFTITGKDSTGDTDVVVTVHPSTGNDVTVSVKVKPSPSAHTFVGDGSEANPYTVADALAYCTKNIAKTNGTYSTSKYYVTGKVKSVSEYTVKDTTVKDYTIILTDDAKNEFKVSYALLATGVDVPETGATITAYGFLQYYNTYSVGPKDTKNYETGDWPVIKTVTNPVVQNETKLISATFNGTDATVSHSADNKDNTWTKGNLTVESVGSTDYSGNAQCRWYANGTLEITFNQDFNCIKLNTDGDKNLSQADLVLTSLTDGVTVTIDTELGKINLSKAVKTIKIKTTKQVRILSMDLILVG